MIHDQQMNSTINSDSIAPVGVAVVNEQFPVLLDNGITSDEKFSCETCSRDFLKRSKLNRHIREHHMNIKEQVCPECGKNFKRNSHLKRHMIAHSTNPKPHSCSYQGCYMAFTCKHHLDRHIRIIHLEDYQNKCEFCPAKFPKKITLSKHMTFDHGKSKPLFCGACQKSFFSQTIFGSHKCSPKKFLITKASLHLTVAPTIIKNQSNMSELEDEKVMNKKRKSPFQPVYEENRNFCLSGDQKQFETIGENPPIQNSNLKFTGEAEDQKAKEELFVEDFGSQINVFRSRNRQDSQQGSISAQMKLPNRRLSELFLLNDQHERKTSINSDYGNLTIFKDLFTYEQQEISRKASFQANSRRKSSFFHLQKIENHFTDQEMEIDSHRLRGQLLSLDQVLNQEIIISFPQEDKQLEEGTALLSDSKKDYTHFKQNDQESNQKQEILSFQNESQKYQFAGLIQKDENQSNSNGDHDEEIDKLAQTAISSQKKADDKCYRCYYESCDKFYTKLSNLKTHIRTFHFKSKDFTCHYAGCKSAYLHKKSLKEHITRVHRNVADSTTSLNFKQTSSSQIIPSSSHNQILVPGQQKPIYPEQIDQKEEFLQSNCEDQIPQNQNNLAERQFVRQPDPLDYFNLHENDLAITLFASIPQQNNDQERKINYHQEFRDFQQKQIYQSEQSSQYHQQQSNYSLQVQRSNPPPYFMKQSSAQQLIPTQNIESMNYYPINSIQNKSFGSSNLPRDQNNNNFYNRRSFENHSTDSSISSSSSFKQHHQGNYLNYSHIQNNLSFPQPHQSQHQIYISQ